MNDFVRGLKCRLCGKTYPKKPLNYCEEDFGPLEVDYDYRSIRAAIQRRKIEISTEVAKQRGGGFGQ